MTGRPSTSSLMNALIAATLFLLICPQAQPAALPKATVTSQEQAIQPQYGGVFKRILPFSPKNFGYPPEMAPTNDWGCATPAVQTLMSPLVEKGAPKPLLAAAWKYSPDYKSLTITLRKGVKFHDGTDFNAEAVKFNLEETRKTMVELRSITSIDTLDEHAVRLNLSQFKNALITNLSGPLGAMVSPTAIKKNGKEWARNHPVGTGPFRFVSYQRDVSLKYEKFDGYWDKGKPYLDGVEFIFISDPTVARMSFERGDAHAITVGARDARELASKGYKVSSYRISGYALGGDSANPNSIFANKKVREAIEYAIDKEAIVKALGYGFWEPMYQLCPANWEGYNPAVKARKYDPAKARQLLAEAGYPKGFKTRMIAQVGGIDSEAWVAMQRYLKEIGIEAELDMAEWSRWDATIFEGWKNAINQVSLGAFRPYTMTIERCLSSTTRQNPSIRKPQGWDDLLSKALAATDDTASIRLTQELMKMAHDEVMVIPIFLLPRNTAKQTNVQNDNLTRYDSQHWTPADTWLSK